VLRCGRAGVGLRSGVSGTPGEDLLPTADCRAPGPHLGKYLGPCDAWDA
jgi:hypothetical protein